MKTRITLLVALLFLGFNFTTAQGNEEDMNTLSIFSEYAKAKNYDAAYEPWMQLRKRNPKFNRAIFTYGENILEHKIENSKGAEQVAFIKDLVAMWAERRMHFASKTDDGEFVAKSCQLQYDYRNELNMTESQLYDWLNHANKTDKAKRTKQKSI